MRCTSFRGNPVPVRRDWFNVVVVGNPDFQNSGYDLFPLLVTKTIAQNTNNKPSICTPLRDQARRGRRTQLPRALNCTGAYMKRSLAGSDISRLSYRLR